MLIISKFRDYYDNAVGYGIDKSIIYQRETSVIKSDEFLLDHYIAGDNFYRSNDWVKDSKITLHEWKIIGFCGKTYVLLIEKTKGNIEESTPEIIECFYGEEALEQVFKNKKDKWRYKETLEFIDKWNKREFTDFFTVNKVPIFVAQSIAIWSRNKGDVVLNPPLAELKFSRIFDSVSAFQEIQMFISGVLGTGSPKTLEISNNEKIKQYGYDTKWSFRNPDPPKRKQ